MKEAEHKDIVNARRCGDEENVLKLVFKLTKYEVSQQTNDLVVPTTRNVANDIIEKDLLQAKETGYQSPKVW